MLEGLPIKADRAWLVREHLGGPGAKVVCFSCGNAAAALRNAELDVIEVGSGHTAMLRPARWWSPAEVRAAWPDRFDATPGHLPMPMLVGLAARVRRYLAFIPPRGTVAVPSGSGETVLAVHLARPDLGLVAVYSDVSSATRWEPQAPLNDWVATVAAVVRIPDPELHGSNSLK